MLLRALRARGGMTTVTRATGMLRVTKLAVLERHFHSIASIKGKRVQPPRGCGKAGKVVHSGLSGMPTEESLASYPRCDIQLCWLTESLASR